MKNRENGFLSEEKIDHDGEIFDYIKEVHSYLWRIVRVAYPGASGYMNDYLDAAIEKLESAEQSVQMKKHDRELLKRFSRFGQFDLSWRPIPGIWAIQFTDHMAKDEYIYGEKLIFVMYAASVFVWSNGSIRWMVKEISNRETEK